MRPRHRRHCMDGKLPIHITGLVQLNVLSKCLFILLVDGTDVAGQNMMINNIYLLLQELLHVVLLYRYSIYVYGIPVYTGT